MEIDEETEIRFAHLLKPIRDLGHVFDVEIAPLLLEYLDELDKVRISIEGGDLNLNFAEAALLIQGSAAVYSKKVELLYSLVFQVLEELSSSSSPSLSTSSSSSVEEGVREEKKRMKAGELDKEQQENVSLLDNSIRISNNITLGRALETLEETQGLRERIPLALLANSPSANALTSGGFRMISCEIDSSGAFLLEGSSSANRSLFEMKHAGEAQGPNKNVEDSDEMDDDDDFDDGFGLQFADADSDGEGEEEQVGDRLACRQQDTTDEGLGLKSLPRDDTYTENDGDEDQGDDVDEGFDPWERLDPHASGDARDTVPLAVGKTWTVPPALKSKKKGNDNKESAGERLTGKNLMVSVVLQPRLCAKLPRKSFVVLLPEMRDYALQQRKVEKRERREKEAKRRLQHKQTSADEANPVNYDEIEDEQFQLSTEIEQKYNEDQASDNEDDYYHDFSGGGGGDSWDDDDLEQPQDRTNQGTALWLSSDGFGQSPDSYVEMVKVHLQQYLETANQWASESKLHSRVRKWEERIQPFLQEQSKRPLFDIHQYGGQILGQLQHSNVESEDTLAFEEIVSKFKALETTTQSPFDEDVEEEEKDTIEQHRQNHTEEDQDSVSQFEVCRMFLASLQLANNGNVELVHEDNTAPLRLRLRDSILANHKLQEYRAPSAMDKLEEKKLAETDDDDIGLIKAREKKRVKTSSTRRGAKKTVQIETS